jgi:hypothetical protein
MSRHDTPPVTPPGDVIKTALEDWWITADPGAPFEPAEAAGMALTYLLGSGYTIRHHTEEPAVKNPVRTTCDASLIDAGSAVGPCVLRRRHGGPVHQDAAGSTWCTQSTRSGLGALAGSSFLALACFLGTLGALAHGDYGWATVGAFGTYVLGREAADDLYAYRTRRSRT